jgi:hypothetical protein
MSYARWSDSSWYAFYNENGMLSLWYDIDHTYNITFEEASEITEEEIQKFYGCTEDEAKEAMTYVQMFIQDYDPAIGDEFQKELDELMAKLKDMKDKENE